MSRKSLLLLPVPIRLIAAGCSGAGDLSPLLPVQSSCHTSELDPSALSDGHNLWLYEQVYVDAATLQYEISPVRIAQNHWNVLSWLENGPCTDCFSIQGLSPGGYGTLLIDIAVSHPFASSNLTGFDVRGIAMFSGSRNYPVLGLNTPDKLQGDGELVNAAGRPYSIAG